MLNKGFSNTWSGAPLPPPGNDGYWEGIPLCAGRLPSGYVGPYGPGTVGGPGKPPGLGASGGLTVRPGFFFLGIPVTSTELTSTLTEQSCHSLVTLIHHRGQLALVRCTLSATNLVPKVPGGTPLLLLLTPLKAANTEVGRPHLLLKPVRGLHGGYPLRITGPLLTNS